MSFGVSLRLKARVFACSVAASITQADSAQLRSRKCMGKYASVVRGYLNSSVKTGVQGQVVVTLNTFFYFFG